jgi:hypothetical protein
MNRDRHLILPAVTLLVGYLAGALFHGPTAGDAKIIEVLVDENLSLKEENELRQKIIDTLKAERRELNSANPT